MRYYVLKLKGCEPAYISAYGVKDARKRYHEAHKLKGGCKPEILKISEESYKHRLKRQIEEYKQRIDKLISMKNYGLEEAKEVSILTAHKRAKEESLKRISKQRQYNK